MLQNDKVHDIPGDKSQKYAKRWANATMAPPRQLRGTERGHGRVFRAFVAVLLWPFCHLPTFGRTGVIYPLGYRALDQRAQYPGGQITKVRQKVGKWHNGPSKTAEKDRKGPRQGFPGLGSCFAVASLPFAYLWAYWGDLTPGISCT